MLLRLWKTFGFASSKRRTLVGLTTSQNRSMSKQPDVAAKREASQMDFFIYPTVLPRDNRKLSAAEFLLAKNICTEIVQLVEGRNGYIQAHDIDNKFALPDAAITSLYQLHNFSANLLG